MKPAASKLSEVGVGIIASILKRSMARVKRLLGKAKILGLEWRPLEIPDHPGCVVKSLRTSHSEKVDRLKSENLGMPQI